MRQNPHVRICGGPGSATTLVYPTTYKIPRYWKIVDAFPMTVTGKVQKYRMREVSTEELGLASAPDDAYAEDQQM